MLTFTPEEWAAITAIRDRIDDASGPKCVEDRAAVVALNKVMEYAWSCGSRPDPMPPAPSLEDDTP